MTARSQWGVNDHEIVFGAVGRIEAQKNPLALIDHVRDAGLSREVKVVWIGDGSLREDLEAHARESEVSLIIDGWRSDASTRLAGFDVFLLPSKFEGLPLAILEAMHAGVPVIAPNTDGIPEAIEHRVTGFLCAADTDWQAAAQALAHDDLLRARMSKAAKQKAIDGFSEISMARRTLEIYQNRISV
jgi:glycosyltransferase involved in cell wall biosynthesis